MVVGWLAAVGITKSLRAQRGFFFTPGEWRFTTFIVKVRSEVKVRFYFLKV